MLTNKSILVTGGLGKIGLALALEIEKRGGKPILSSRQADKVDEFNKEAISTKRSARAYQFSPQNKEDVGVFIGQLLADYPTIDGLVNNASPDISYQDIEEVDWDVWAEAATVSLGLPVTLTTQLIAQESNLTVIVNVSSMYSLIAPDFSMYPEGRPPSAIFYGTIKAGLNQLTRHLSSYLSPQNIRVNSVSPGGVFNHQDKEFLDRYNNSVPMGRMVTREEVANTICFLLGDDSSGITGENIMIDGGKTII